MKLVFRTDIYICKQDVMSIPEMWLTEQHVPRVGERLQMLNYELEVVQVGYEPYKRDLPHVNILGNYRPYSFRAVVELHIPSWFKGTIHEWEERVKKQRQIFFAENKLWPMLDVEP